MLLSITYVYYLIVISYSHKYRSFLYLQATFANIKSKKMYTYYKYSFLYFWASLININLMGHIHTVDASFHILVNMNLHIFLSYSCKYRSRKVFTLCEYFFTCLQDFLANMNLVKCPHTINISHIHKAPLQTWIQ